MLGSGGAGKSTVARAIAAATGLPLVHLDRLYRRPGWRPTPAEEWERVVADVVAGDRWVLDGNDGGTLTPRLAAADTAFFLDVPRTTCLLRVVRRALRHRRVPREDVAPGCPDRLTREFVGWIWAYPARRRPGVLAELEEFGRRGGRVVALRDGGEIAAFVESLAG